MPVSLRALFVVQPDRNGPQPLRVLLSKRFPTVERRFQQSHTAWVESIQGTPLESVGLPSDAEFCRLLCASGACADAVPRLPVLELRGEGVSLWPVVLVPWPRGSEDNAVKLAEMSSSVGKAPLPELLLVGVPLADGGFKPPAANVRRPAVAELPCVTAAVELLECVGCIIEKSALNFSADTGVLDDDIVSLKLCLSNAMPFGTPVQTMPEVVRACTIEGAAFSIDDKLRRKRPSWRPFRTTLQGSKNPKISLVVRERLSAALCGLVEDGAALETTENRSNASDVKSSSSWCLSGSVNCLATLPDVYTVTVRLRNIGVISVHPCCVQLQSSAVPSDGRLSFSPPTFPFELCRYRAYAHSGTAADAMQDFHSTAENLSTTPRTTRRQTLAPRHSSVEERALRLLRGSPSSEGAGSVCLGEEGSVWGEDGIREWGGCGGVAHRFGKLPFRASYRAYWVREANDDLARHGTQLSGERKGAKRRVGLPCIRLMLKIWWEPPATSEELRLTQLRIDLPFLQHGDIFDYELETNSGAFVVRKNSCREANDEQQPYPAIVWRPKLSSMESRSSILLSGSLFFTPETDSAEAPFQGPSEKRPTAAGAQSREGGHLIHRGSDKGTANKGTVMGTNKGGKMSSVGNESKGWLLDTLASIADAPSSAAAAVVAAAARGSEHAGGRNATGGDNRVLNAELSCSAERSLSSKEPNSFAAGNVFARVHFKIRGACFSPLVVDPSEIALSK